MVLILDFQFNINDDVTLYVAENELGLPGAYICRTRNLLHQH